MIVRFRRDCRGGAAPLLALCAIPLLGAVGASIDYTRASGARAAMQSALDTAALALVRTDPPSEASAFQASAAAFFEANFARTDVLRLRVDGSASRQASGTTVALSASGAVKTQFMHVLGLTELEIGARASTTTAADGLGCVLSLNKAAAGAITAQGAPVIKLNACSIYNNSSDPAALTVGGSARLSALSIGVVGGVSGTENIAVAEGLRTGIAPVPDPYGDRVIPAVGACTTRNYTGRTVETIDPGVYCGGMKINAGAEITLNPGLYVLDGGDLFVNGSARLSGTGVTLVFTMKNANSWATATINGGAEVNLSPPRSGPTAGLVMFGDRNLPVGTDIKLAGGSSQYLAGAVYFPSAALTFAGGTGSTTSCTQIIGDTVTFVGNSSLAIDCSSHNTRPLSSQFTRITN